MLGPSFQNIILALAIATVKATLVCAIFMHLWWDKPVNTLVLLFSVVLLALFLGLFVGTYALYETVYMSMASSAASYIWSTERARSRPSVSR